MLGVAFVPIGMPIIWDIRRSQLSNQTLHDEFLSEALDENAELCCVLT